MDKPNKTIANSIESGTYFRFAMLIVTVIILIGTYVMIDLANLSYQDKKYPFPLFATDQVKYFPRIKNIARASEDVNVSMAKYLCSYYVDLRESYNFENYSPENRKDTFLKVANLSTRKTYNDFEELNDPLKNPDAPVIIYKNSVKRNIEVTEIKTDTSTSTPNFMTVFYNIITKASDGSTTTEKYRAEINFNMTYMMNVINHNNDFSFLVIGYQTYKL
jgi:type IV secretory pathway component VirB8